MAGCVLSYSHQPLFIWVTIVVISYFQKPWEDSISLRPQTLFPWSSTLRRWERALDGKWTIISRCPSLPLVLDPRDYNLPHPPRGFLHPASLAPFSPGYKLDVHTSSASSLRNPRTWAGCLSPALPLGLPLGNPSKYRKGGTEDIIRTLSFFFFFCRLRFQFDSVFSSVLRCSNVMITSQPWKELFSLASFISDPLIFMCLPADKPELSEPPVTAGGKIRFWQLYLPPEDTLCTQYLLSKMCLWHSLLLFQRDSWNTPKRSLKPN